MFGRPHHFSALILGLVFVFSMILIIVSLSIIDQNRDYHDLFRPPLGLAAFNIVVSSLGILIGAIGLCLSLAGNPLLARIIAVLMFILGIFSLASLITALVINSRAADHLSNNFNQKMRRYETDATAKEIVDSIQTDCECCGFNSWLDYGINQTDQGLTTASTLATSISTTSTSTDTTTTITTTLSVSPTSDTSPTDSSSASTASSSSPSSESPPTDSSSSSSSESPPTESSSSSSSESPPTDPPSSSLATEVPTSASEPSSPTSPGDPQSSESTTSGSETTLSPSRRNLKSETNKRIEYSLGEARRLQSNNHSMISVSLSRQLMVPFTCCINQSPTGDCAVTKLFYSDGCSMCMIGRMNRHDMGIAILNCFLIISSFLSIPLLLSITTKYESTDDIDTAIGKRHRESHADQKSPSVVFNRL